MRLSAALGEQTVVPVCHSGDSGAETFAVVVLGMASGIPCIGCNRANESVTRVCGSIACRGYDSSGHRPSYACAANVRRSNGEATGPFDDWTDGWGLRAATDAEFCPSEHFLGQPGSQEIAGSGCSRGNRKPRVRPPGGTERTRQHLTELQGPTPNTQYPRIERDIMQEVRAIDPEHSRRSGCVISVAALRHSLQVQSSSNSTLADQFNCSRLEGSERIL